jgi:hypothetical protein
MHEGAKLAPWAVKVMSAMKIMVEIAPGELIDKMTILEIKLEHLVDPQKLSNVRLEYEGLSVVYAQSIMPSEMLSQLTSQLKDVNSRLWQIEDDIRDLERQMAFGPNFVELARSVYRANDERSAIKRRINEMLDSKIIEEKSYAAY